MFHLKLDISITKTDCLTTTLHHFLSSGAKPKPTPIEDKDHQKEASVYIFTLY